MGVLASPFSINSLTAPAVPSGLSVILRPPLSSNVYISLFTTSVVSPTPRKNSSVCSNTGVRTSFMLKISAVSLADFSMNCHLQD